MTYYCSYFKTKRENDTVLSLLSIILVIIVLIIFLKNIKNPQKIFIDLTLLLLFFGIHVNTGYFLRIGNFYVSYTEFLLVLTFGLSLFFLRNIKVNYIKIFSFVSLIVVILIGWLKLNNVFSDIKVLPIGGSWDALYWGENTNLLFSEINLVGITGVMRLFVLIMIFTITIVLIDFVKNNPSLRKKLIKSVVHFGVFIALFCVFEQIYKIITTNDLFILKWLFNDYNHPGRYFSRGGLPALQGFTMEPSHLVRGLIVSLILILFFNYWSKKRKIVLNSLFLYILIFSGSASGIVIAGVFLFFLAYLKLPLRLFTAISIVFLVVSGFLIAIFIDIPFVSYYIDRFSFFVGNTSSIGSEGVRTLSIKSVMNVFFENPLFGRGFGITNAHGFIPSILSNVGILGVIFWFFSFVPIIKLNLKLLIAFFLFANVYWYLYDLALFYSVELIIVSVIISTIGVEYKDKDLKIEQ